MRRFSAMMLGLLLVPILLPLIASPNLRPDSQLPACCRRDGRHHCGMTTSADPASQETSIHQQSASCPYRSALRFVRTFVPHPAPSSAFYAGIIEHPAVHAQVNVQLVVSQVRSHQKRGPPSLSFR